MGEVNGDCYGRVNGGEEDERVHEWEEGLPNADDLTPLTQGLIPPELLSAFNIKPEPYPTSGDITRASEVTLSTLRNQSTSSNFKPFDSNNEVEVIDEEENDDDSRSDSKKSRRNESPEDADSASAAVDKTLKRARLVWTPQLHKRFVDVVTHLGIKNAVPKTIMQLMNVEGLTRENVASHLQKYRLYLKRMQGIPYEGPSNSSSTEQFPVAGNSPENGNGMMIPVPYMPVPVMGMAHGHMGMGNYTGFDSSNHNSHYNHHHHHHHHHQQFQNNMMQSGNNYGSVMSYQHHPPHVAPGDN